MRNRPNDVSPAWEEKKRIRAQAQQLRDGIRGKGDGPGGASGPGDTVLSVKRAPNFEQEGEYEVSLASGAKRYIYRDPENGMWYEARTGKFFTQAFLGFTKKDALEALTR